MRSGSHPETHHIMIQTKSRASCTDLRSLKQENQLLLTAYCQPPTPTAGSSPGWLLLLLLPGNLLLQVQ